MSAAIGVPDDLASSPAKLPLPLPLPLMLMLLMLLTLPWPVQVPTSFSGGPQPMLTQQQQKQKQQQWQPQHCQQHPSQAPGLQVHGLQGLHGSQLQGSTESALTPGQVRCGVIGGCRGLARGGRDWVDGATGVGEQRGSSTLGRCTRSPSHTAQPFVSRTVLCGEQLQAGLNHCVNSMPLVMRMQRVLETDSPASTMLTALLRLLALPHSCLAPSAQLLSPHLG